MAQYDQPVNQVINTLGQNVSQTVLTALQSILPSSGTVPVVSFSQGSAPAPSNAVVDLTGFGTLTQDPGGAVIIAGGTQINTTFTTGNRVIVGSTQSDRIIFQTVQSGVTDDISGNVVSSVQAVTIETGGGNDLISTTSSNDVVTVTGVGNQTINTAQGDDVIVIGTASSQITIDSGTGFDIVRINDASEAYRFSLQGSNVSITNVNANLQNVELVQFGNGISVIAKNYNEAMVARLYDLIYDRQADIDGLKFWLGKVNEGMEVKWLVNSFMNSAEFTQKYGNLSQMSNENFLRLLYQNMANRQPDTEGFNWWLDKLNSGFFDRADVAIRFAVSQEMITLTGINGNHYVIDAY